MLQPIKNKTYGWLLDKCYRGLDKVSNRSIPAVIKIATEVLNKDIARGDLALIHSDKTMILKKSSLMLH